MRRSQCASLAQSARPRWRFQSRIHGEEILIIVADVFVPHGGLDGPRRCDPEWLEPALLEHFHERIISVMHNVLVGIPHTLQRPPAIKERICCLKRFQRALGTLRLEEAIVLEESRGGLQEFPRFTDMLKDIAQGDHVK